jgi:hypothetical protein
MTHFFFVENLAISFWLRILLLYDFYCPDELISESFLLPTDLDYTAKLSVSYEDGGRTIILLVFSPLAFL